MTPTDAVSANRAELEGLDAWKSCGLGICAAEAGHEGTCDEASGWDWCDDECPEDCMADHRGEQ